MIPSTDISVESLVRQALAEDLGTRGDLTSLAVLDKGAIARATIQSKASGVLSGTRLLEPLFRSIDPALSVDVLLQSGAALSPGAPICALAGSVHAILAGERVALNFLQHLGGIATATSALAAKIAHTKARLLDTRKTTPLLRALEKEAVVHGGGTNHRFGLFDMILIKHTHVKAAGGVGPAIRRAQEYVKKSSLAVPIEAETQSVEEFEEALSCVPERIMLDNMSVADMAACVARARDLNAAVELEASGNVSFETIKAIAETGVDFISVGAITHSAPALDIHLIIE
jgi:nicotinate-nucleotide pyrophosphorylase (carboxylating)